MSNDNQPAKVGSSEGLGAGDAPAATVWARRGELERERREFMRQAMAEFDAVYYVKLRALQEECGSSGHNWRFTNLGPLGNPWFSCTSCHKSEARSA